MMYKYIIVCLTVCVCGVFCDLNLSEGEKCQFDGLEGTCVKESQCLTTLDDRNSVHPVCTKNVAGIKIVCCADCEFVNDTSNAVISPNGQLLWKTGEKARDNCLKYIQDGLPYACRQEGSYGGVKRTLDTKRNCHKLDYWAVGGAPPVGYEPGSKFPYHAVLGYGEQGKEAWRAAGTIISDRFVLTVAHAVKAADGVKYIGVGSGKFLHSPDWKIYKVKRTIVHPEYKRREVRNDIALIEVDEPIQFNKNVLPACLHVDPEVDVANAFGATWDPKKSADNDVETLELQRFTDEECKTGYEPRGGSKMIDPKTQMCYGSKNDRKKNCAFFSGEGLMTDKQFTYCINTIIGITSFGAVCGDQGTELPVVFTKVLPYVPWIESVMWP